jgi:hypothetical protein
MPIYPYYYDVAEQMKFMLLHQAPEREIASNVHNNLMGYLANPTSKDLNLVITLQYYVNHIGTYPNYITHFVLQELDNGYLFPWAYTAKMEQHRIIKFGSTDNPLGYDKLLRDALLLVRNELFGVLCEVVSPRSDVSGVALLIEVSSITFL